MTAKDHDVLTAARAWVAAIHDFPNSWAGDEDIALITAVTAAYPGLHTQPAAHWCPTCGNCTCLPPFSTVASRIVASCRLHGTDQRHATVS